MSKSRTTGKGDSAPDESNPDAPTPIGSNPDEPVDLSTLEGGVLHNPPQAKQSQESSTIDEE
ncbi:hypothetical protein GCM10011375_20900 [Hymenobacter qilianensis]|uniref:Uncharacterized protein n=2 Tax=Hymenobacter qilianensis TaxID=1385715 RepID=A0ACB5PRW1_9BACT|nr:hypothetical protein [Hymenobacter qilianensis]QNP52237.1 hypothetical protein H9L05_20730 [Hymenobacter qilianensis]GGF65740.1 hypothetical protein GCM10011375_20900 [Hymenobacter qilianensis]